MRPSTTISARAVTVATAANSSNGRDFQPPCTASMRPTLSDGPPIIACRSAYMFENTVELVERVVTDHQLALARGRVLHSDLGTEFLAQLALQLADVRIHARRVFLGGAVRLRSQALDQRFGLAHRQLLLRDQRADFGLLAPRIEREQRARVTHLQLAMLDQRLHFVGVLE